MLRYLEYSVAFPTTGREFANRIEFEPGLTAVTGRNEAGKTLILEMISYALFGKSALRGAAGDYRNLVVTLELDTLGSAVRIERARNRETLIVDGEESAVGAEAINKAVPALLGFGLDVFNIACAAQQGDIEALTNMKPTARKQMIDHLIGLDALEDIEKECKAEAKTHETVAASLAVSVTEPEPPVVPEGYEPSEDLEKKLRELEEHQRERDRLLLVKEPVAPVEPVAPERVDVEALEAHEAERQRVLQEKAHLEGKLAGMPEPTVSREDLERALAYQQYQEEVKRRGPEPEHPLHQLEEWEHVWEQKDRLHDDTVECPKCQHQFSAYEPDLDVVTIEALEEPPLVRTEITAQYRRHDLWSEPLEAVEEFTIPNLQKEILAHANAEDRSTISATLGSLEVPPDLGGILRAAREYLQERAVFEERARSYRGELDAYEVSQRRLSELGDKSGDQQTVRNSLGDSRHYEALLRRYSDDQERYEAVVRQCAGERSAAEGFTKGAEALKQTRIRVKQELAPTLSLAASSLLARMTDGARRHIVVDHDLNIQVDGQPVQTLSGSGKSVVNLALRIGLGQVLTSKVLPIFLGDEIDASMDDERAGSTHETLQTLRDYLTQIIIVTHKDDFVADQQITI